MSGTQQACKELAQRVRMLSQRLEPRLEFICKVVDGDVELPEGCESSAVLAERELEPLLMELREVYAAAELIRSAVWQDQMRT